MLCLFVLETGFYGSVGDAPGDRQPFLLPSVGLDIQMGRLSNAGTPVALQQLWKQPKDLKGKFRERLFQNLGDRSSLCTNVLGTLQVVVFCCLLARREETFSL